MEQAGRRLRALSAPGPPPPPAARVSGPPPLPAALWTACTRARAARTLQGHAGSSEKAGAEAGLLQVLRPASASSHRGQALGKIGPWLSCPHPDYPAPLPIPGSLLGERFMEQMGKVSGGRRVLNSFNSKIKYGVMVSPFLPFSLLRALGAPSLSQGERVGRRFSQRWLGNEGGRKSNGRAWCPAPPNLISPDSHPHKPISLLPLHPFPLVTRF